MLGLLAVPKAVMSMAVVTNKRTERSEQFGFRGPVVVAMVALVVAGAVGIALVWWANLDTPDRRNSLGVGLLTGVVAGGAVLWVEFALNKSRRAAERAEEEEKRADLVAYSTRELARLIPRYARVLEALLYRILGHAQEAAREVGAAPPGFIGDVRTIWMSVMSISNIDQTRPDWYEDSEFLERVDVTLLVATHLIEFTDEHVVASIESADTVAGEPVETPGAYRAEEASAYPADEDVEESAERGGASPSDDLELEPWRLAALDVAARISGTADILSQFRAPDRAQRLAHVASNITLAAETLDVNYVLGSRGVPPLPHYVDSHGTSIPVGGRNPVTFMQQFVPYVVDLVRTGIAKEQPATPGRLIDRPDDDEIALQRWPSLIRSHEAVDGLWRERYAQGSWLRRALQTGAEDTSWSWGLDHGPPATETSMSDSS